MAPPPPPPPTQQQQQPQQVRQASGPLLPSAIVQQQAENTRRQREELESTGPSKLQRKPSGSQPTSPSPQPVVRKPQPEEESKEKKERLKSEELDRPSTADAVVEDVPSSARKTGFFANFRIRRKHDSFLPTPHSPSPKAQGKQRADAHAPATPTSPPAKGKHGSEKRSHFFS